MIRSPGGRRVPGLLDVAGLFDGPALMEVAPVVGCAIRYAAMQHPIKCGG
jgi:hypothetical protein